MREILGRRRRLRLRRKEGAARLEAALTFATAWQWPVLPGAGTAPAALRDGRGLGCACRDPDCAVPGAHPFDPVLLAATTDERMVRWWWTNRPTAPVILATGGRAPCAVSLPALAGARALVALDRMGMRLGPVVATPTRWSLLVAPYTLERLGELLYSKDWVPSSLRFHGEGGYLVLPPPRSARARSAGSGPRAPGGPGPSTPVLRRITKGGGGRAGRRPPGSRMSRPSWTPWSRRAPAPRTAAADSRTEGVCWWRAFRWRACRRRVLSACVLTARAGPVVYRRRTRAGLCTAGARPACALSVRGGRRTAVGLRGGRCTTAYGPAHSYGCEPGRIGGERAQVGPAVRPAWISSASKYTRRRVRVSAESPALLGYRRCPVTRAQSARGPP